MARSTNNELLKGLKGQLGKELVIKHYGKKIVVSSFPNMEDVKPSPLQQLKRSRFADAMTYAKQQMASKEGYNLYLTRSTSSRRPLNVAVADFLKAPVVKSVNVAEYNGVPLGQIQIEAIDDFQVERVTVTLGFEGKEPVEVGEAILQTDGLWMYLVKKVHSQTEGLIIRVQAYDRPGNVGESVHKY
jgi:hypothetical protein